MLYYVAETRNLASFKKTQTSMEGKIGQNYCSLFIVLISEGKHRCLVLILSQLVSRMLLRQGKAEDRAGAFQCLSLPHLTLETSEKQGIGIGGLQIRSSLVIAYISFDKLLEEQSSVAKFVFGCEQSTYSNGWTELYFNIFLCKGENCLEKNLCKSCYKKVCVL